MDNLNSVILFDTICYFCMTLCHVKVFHLKIMMFYYDESLYRITMPHFAPCLIPIDAVSSENISSILVKNRNCLLNITPAQFLIGRKVSERRLIYEKFIDVGWTSSDVKSSHNP